MTTFEFRDRTIGRYAVIGPQRDVADDPNVIILDTNVLIDMADFYFGTRRDQGIRSDLLSLLSEFPDVRVGQKVDINYGFAVKEASWKRGIGPDRADHRRLVHAASTMVNWTVSEVESNFANRHAPVSRDKAWPLRVPLPPQDEVGDNPIILFLSTYGSFLYLCHLDRTRAAWRNKGPLDAMTQYVTWMTDELGIFDVYAVQLGLDLLLGDEERRNGVRKLLRRGGNEEPDLLANRCWNAAWDVFFLRLTEGSTFRLGGYSDWPEGNAVLLTRNVDPGFIRAQSEIRAVLQLPSDSRLGNLPFLEIDWSKHPLARDDDDVVVKLLSRHMMDPTRPLRDADKLLEGGVPATRDVELTLGVTKSALMGFHGFGD